MIDVIVSSWLYKSPSEKKLWKPFKQAWQKRFFVLTHEFKVKFKLELNYYDSEDRSNKKGSIDLDNCIEIRMEADDTNVSDDVSHLLNGQQPFKYIFSLRLKHHDRERVYFLGSESLENIDAWMQCLRTVLYKKSQNTVSENHKDIAHFSSFRRPKSSEVHRHNHQSNDNHLSQKWGSFHAPKNEKSYKKLKNHTNPSENSSHSNSKSQQNVSNRQKRPSHKQCCQQQHYCQKKSSHPSEEFDYIVPVQDDTFQDDLNESYVLLDQCFSGFKNEQQNENLSENTKYRLKNKPGNSYLNSSQLKNNNYYNTASDDSIFCNSNPQAYKSKSKLRADSLSYNNLACHPKYQHNLSDEYSYYPHLIDLQNDELAKQHIHKNQPDKKTCKLKNTSNNHRRETKRGLKPQVLSHRFQHHSQPRSTKLQPCHNYNSMTLFNNMNHKRPENNDNIGDFNESLGFYTLPPKAGGKIRKYEKDIGWYNKNLSASFDQSSDSNDDEEDEDDDDDDFFYEEDSSPFTESSECPCKLYNCSNIYPKLYPLPPQKKTQNPSLPPHHSKFLPLQNQKMYKTSDETNRAYFNPQSLHYLELDLDQCSINNQPLATNDKYIVKTAPAKHNYNLVRNNSATQYTQIDINKTRGLQDTKFHLENERRNSDKVGENVSLSNNPSTTIKTKFYPQFNIKNTVPFNSNIKNNFKINPNHNNAFFDIKNKKSRNTDASNKDSYTNITRKGCNNKSYSSTVF